MIRMNHASLRCDPIAPRRIFSHRASLSLMPKKDTVHDRFASAFLTLAWIARNSFIFTIDCFPLHVRLSLSLHASSAFTITFLDPAQTSKFISHFFAIERGKSVDEHQICLYHKDDRRRRCASRSSRSRAASRHHWHLSMILPNNTWAMPIA